jgi:hypothetical protein
MVDFSKEKLKSLNWPAFLFSCFFVVYGFINISKEPWIMAVMGLLGLYVEWEAQNVWGLSFYYWQKKQYFKSGSLKAVFILYITVFGIMSGVGFFATEIAHQEAVSKKIETIETNTQNRIKQLNKLIEVTTNQMEEEGKTTARTIYFKLQDKLDEYQAELNELLKPKKIVVETDKAQMKDMFANMSKVLWNIPKNVLILVQFGLALTMVYLGLALRPIAMNGLATDNETPERNPLHKTSYNETEKPGLATDSETDSQTSNIDTKIPVSLVRKDRYCQYSKCGKLLSNTLRSDAKYCDDNCRLAAFREEKKQKEV